MRKINWRPSWQPAIFILIIAVVAAIDQVSKQWIRSNVLLGDFYYTLGPLTITHINNTGSAFGLFRDQGFILSIIAVAGLIAILFFYRYISRSHVLGNIALGLIFGGALGNLLDRFRLGFVTDFIYVKLWSDFYWPAFNVADSAVVVGTILMVIVLIMTIQKENREVSESTHETHTGRQSRDSTGQIPG